MSKFTPGSWKMHKVNTEGEFVTERKIISEDGSVLANIGPCNIDPNARLIAKAPEMYDMIEDLRKVLITIYDTNHMAPMIDRYLRDIKELQNQIKGE